METSVISIIPNLGIGVVAVLSLVYVTREFIRHLKDLNLAHMQELKEREIALRAVEKEVRTSIMNQLAENAAIMKEVVNIHNIRK